MLQIFSPLKCSNEIYADKKLESISNTKERNIKILVNCCLFHHHKVVLKQQIYDFIQKILVGD